MITSKKDLLYYLEQDRIYLNKKRKSPRLIGDEVWKYQILLRKEEYFNNTGKRYRAFLFKIFRHRLGLKLGFTIGINVFGPGLSIAHYGSIIVNSSARIGCNCRIHSGVNIGTKAGASKNAPTIGDNVYIGPGAKIFGPVILGDNLAIGANAVVNKSFENGNCTIGGVPARVISDRNSENLWLKSSELEFLKSI
jgi:serine O-acetyltransferase